MFHLLCNIPQAIPLNDFVIDVTFVRSCQNTNISFLGFRIKRTLNLFYDLYLYQLDIKLAEIVMNSFQGLITKGN